MGEMLAGLKVSTNEPAFRYSPPLIPVGTNVFGKENRNKKSHSAEAEWDLMNLSQTTGYEFRM